MNADYHAFLQHLADRQTSPHSIRSHKSTIRHFITWLQQTHGLDRVDHITADHLHAYQKHLAALRTRKGMPLKPSTLNKRINGAKTFLRYCHNRSRITRPLADHLHYVKQPQLLPTSVLTHAQVKQLLRAVDTTTTVGIRDRALIELLYSTGIRIGELENLTLDHLDLQPRILQVTGKGGRQRLVPIGHTAARHLTSYIRGARPFLDRHRTTTHACNALFLNLHGTPLRGHRIRAHLHRYAHKAKLNINVTPHTFRRTCTTEMIRANANLYHIKQLLGHQTLSTLKHYTKLNIHDLQATHRNCHPRERDDQP